MHGYEIDFSVLVGKTLVSATIIPEDYDHNESIQFIDDSGVIYIMKHQQDCCEYSRIEDICGDLNDLIGTPILSAYESSSKNLNIVEALEKDSTMTGDQLLVYAALLSDGDDADADNDGNSTTWTFYRLSTIKGSVVIRWYVTSNGYYSEKISFVKF